MVEDHGLQGHTGAPTLLTTLHCPPNLSLHLQVSEETVLTDPTGLHLGAGPYFLIYSRAIPWEDEDMRSSWPEDVKVCSVFVRAVLF